MSCRPAPRECFFFVQENNEIGRSVDIGFQILSEQGPVLSKADHQKFVSNLMQYLRNDSVDAKVRLDKAIKYMDLRHAATKGDHDAVKRIASTAVERYI